MTVIKKSGKKEEFSMGKLTQSLKYANQRTEEEMNISALEGDFNRIVEEKTVITTKQIDVIIYGLLYSKGLLQTLVSYISYDEKDKT